MSSKDVLKRRESFKRWYVKNKEKCYIWNKQKRQKLKSWFQDYKSNLKCNICNENNIACLDFHHINPCEKEINISHAIISCWSKKRILDELQKCEVLCKNCHAKLHYNEK